MRRIFLIVLTLIVHLSIYGQVNNTCYEVTYTFWRDLGLPVQDVWTLTLDDEQSLFVKEKYGNVQPSTKDGVAIRQHVIKTEEEIVPHLYIVFKSDSIYSQGQVFKTTYYVKDPIHKPSWEILPDTKNISGYACQKATGHFRGRDYDVWFTNEIPIQAGPWKLNGLPGLIIYAEDQTGSIRFTATTITALDHFSVKAAYQDLPKFGKTLTLREYISLKDGEGLEMIKYITAKSGRTGSSTITDLAGRSTAMEIAYEWEEN